MSRVRTFSLDFPHYHPKARQRTQFPEQILNSLCIDYRKLSYLSMLEQLNPDKPERLIKTFWHELEYHQSNLKKHTIRANQHFKAGDKFSPAVWTGQPYHSKQIKFAPDITVFRTQEYALDTYGFFSVDGYTPNLEQYHKYMMEIAKNDGFAELQDFADWFTRTPGFRKNGFFGQVIIWNDVHYEPIE